MFPYSYCLGLFISVCFLQLRLFHKCAASIFPLLIALHFLLLLSCFLPICMPKVEVCVSSVSMFTFRLCCYFPPTCSSLSMPFPNNGNAKTRWRSSYCGPERKTWGQKGNYNHGSLTEWSGSEANSRTLIALFQFYKTSLTNFLDTLYLWNSKFAILKKLKIQLKKIITYPLTLQPITYPLPLLNK